MPGIRVSTFAILLVTLLFSRSVLPNDGPPPEFWELIQEGQNVQVVLAYESEGCFSGVYASMGVDIWRSDGVVLFPVYKYAELMGEVGTTEPFCKEPLDPCEGDCFDCDGDGVNECLGNGTGEFKAACCYKMLYGYEDPCVLPGVYEYGLFDMDTPPSHDMPWWVQSMEITVVESGIECEPPDWEPPENDSPDTDTDTESDGLWSAGGNPTVGCTIGSLGSPDPGSLLSILLLPFE